MYPTSQSSSVIHWWRGRSGQWRAFVVRRLDEWWDFTNIVYIAARLRRDGLYDPLYIGQTADGGERFSRHEKLPAARRLGMTHLHFHFTMTRTERFEVETDLRRNFATPLNEQPTPDFGDGLASLFPSVAALAPIGGLPMAPCPPANLAAALGALWPSPLSPTSEDLSGLSAFPWSFSPQRR